MYEINKIGVLGMVGTIDGKIVPLETPDAKPWYKIDFGYATNIDEYIMLTDGDKYCWRNRQGDISPLTADYLFGNKDLCWRGTVIRDEAVRDAIERYNKEIGV